MAKNEEWGSHIEVIAIADIFGIPILITNDSSDDEEFQVWIYPTADSVQTTQLMLLGFCYNHYYSLEGDYSIVTSCAVQLAYI